jgi:putative addiction module component (TIGR02574 family)
MEFVMAATIHTLGLDRLPVDEQLSLVRELWDHIAASGPTPRMSEAQRQELRRRVAEDDAHPDDVIPWEQVKAELDRRRADYQANPSDVRTWEQIEARLRREPGTSHG